MKLSYYPGCTVKNEAKNFEDSTLSSLDVLGVEVEEIDRWNCCGTVYSLAEDDVMRRMAPVRNLMRAKEMGASTLMTSCAMCYNTTKRANNFVKENPDVLARMNDFMTHEEDYEGEVETTHLLEVIRDKIGFEEVEAKVETPLKDLKVASYYGCLLVRPGEIAIDDTESPTIMEDLTAAIGAEPIEFAQKTECCGAYQTVDKPEIIADRTFEILTSAQEQGADMVSVSCPLCAFNLDQRQKATLKKYPQFRHIPIVYFTELMAVALGRPETALTPELHYISPNPILKEKGLL